MADWPSSQARRVLAALYRLGWALKRETGSHKSPAPAGPISCSPFMIQTKSALVCSRGLRSVQVSRLAISDNAC